jgi:sugar phosphate isomerase/epimerase
MRIGCCGSIEHAPAIREAGFDFLEVNVQGILKGDLDDADWSRTAPDVDRLPLPIEAANSLVPGTLPVVGDGRDLDLLGSYMRRVASRAASLGIECLVFGSGKARRRPADLAPATATAQLEEFCRLAADACADHGIVLVIEHLNRGETNTINTLDEASRLCEAVDHPNLAVLVDSYHYGLEQESDQSLLGLGSSLRHVHVAEPVDRIEPGGHAGTGKAGQAFDFVHFFSLLRKLGYDRRISFEGRWSRSLEESASPCVREMRRAWAQA